MVHPSLCTHSLSSAHFVPSQNVTNKTQHLVQSNNFNTGSGNANQSAQSQQQQQQQQHQSHQHHAFNHNQNVTAKKGSEARFVVYYYCGLVCPYLSLCHFIAVPFVSAYILYFFVLFSPSCLCHVFILWCILLMLYPSLLLVQVPCSID